MFWTKTLCSRTATGMSVKQSGTEIRPKERKLHIGMRRLHCWDARCISVLATWLKKLSCMVTFCSGGFLFSDTASWPIFFKSIANDFRGLPKRITGSLRTLRVQPPWPCQYHRGTYEPSWFASCAGFWTRVAWNRVLGNHGSPIDFAPWEPRNIETSLIS